MWPLGAGLLGVGLVVAIIGGVAAGRHVRRLRHWATDRATVVGYDWSGVGDRSVQHWIIERRLSDGGTARSRTTMGTSWGTMRSFPFDIDVLVDPADETRFVARSGCRSGAAGFAMVLGGAVLMALGGLVLCLTLR